MCCWTMARELAEGLTGSIWPRGRFGAVFYFEETEHVLRIAIHHIVCDGWSVNLLLTELSAVYNAIIVSEAPVLAPLTLRYSDYAWWERKSLANHPLDRIWLSGRKSCKEPSLEHSLPTEATKSKEQEYGECRNDH